VGITVEQLLAHPELSATLIAGAEGLGRRGPIRWAHTTELVDPTPWLEGGELLLTTGLGLRDDASAQRRFVAGIAAHGVVALGVALGISMEAMPAELVAACDEHDLPLFTLPYEVPFIAVSRLVADAELGDQYTGLRDALDLHRQLLAAVVADAGVAGVLERVARVVPGIGLLAFDFGGRPLASAGAPCPPNADVWEALPDDRPRGTVVFGDIHLRFATVLLGERAEAVLVAASTTPLSQADELAFEQGVAGISLDLARRRSVRESRRDRIEELLDELDAGRMGTEDLERRLERLGAVLPARYRVLAIGRRQGDREREVDVALYDLIEDLLVEDGRPFVGLAGGHLWAVVPDESNAPARIRKVAASRGWPDVNVGRSRVGSGAVALPTAIREAEAALADDGPAPVRDAADLGLSGLLAAVRDDVHAADFVERVLGPVLAHDAETSAQLADTLRAYLAHGCRPGPAAEQLRIHRHTLTYRLDRVRDLTGRDPRAGEHLVEFGLALELAAQG
jgi:PucR family transcriptional regulator, purine catabolism regulatory protein